MIIIVRVLTKKTDNKDNGRINNNYRNSINDDL